MSSLGSSSLISSYPRTAISLTSFLFGALFATAVLTLGQVSYSDTSSPVYTPEDLSTRIDDALAWNTPIRSRNSRRRHRRNRYRGLPALIPAHPITSDLPTQDVPPQLALYLDDYITSLDPITRLPASRNTHIAQFVSDFDRDYNRQAGRR